MSWKSKMLRFARQVVQNVTSQLTQQQQMVEQMALAPVRGIVSQVTGGVWKGDGADKFVQELSTMMIPGIGRVGSQITNFNKNLQRAIQVMDQADQQVNSMAKSAGELFSKIF
jgi:hypothetical protein